MVEMNQNMFLLPKSTHQHFGLQLSETSAVLSGVPFLHCATYPFTQSPSYFTFQSSIRRLYCAATLVHTFLPYRQSHFLRVSTTINHCWPSSQLTTLHRFSLCADPSTNTARAIMTTSTSGHLKWHILGTYRIEHYSTLIFHMVRKLVVMERPVPASRHKSQYQEMDRRVSSLCGSILRYILYK